jgi:hypothetical protein
MYNLELLGKARTRVSKHLKSKRQKGAGDRVEPTIEVDTEMAEVQVGQCVVHSAIRTECVADQGVWGSCH